MNSVVFHTNTPSKQIQLPFTPSKNGRPPIDELSNNIFNAINTEFPHSSTKKRRVSEINYNQSPVRMNLFQDDSSYVSDNNSSPILVKTASKAKRVVSKASVPVERFLRGGKKLPDDYIPDELLKLRISVPSVSVQREINFGSPEAMSEDDDLCISLPTALYYEEEQKEKKAKENNAVLVEPSFFDGMDFSYRCRLTSNQLAFLESISPTSNENTTFENEQVTPFAIRTAPVNDRVREPVSDTSKKPVVVSLHDSRDEKLPKSLIMNGKCYTIQLMGKGSNHYVYSFIDSEEMKGRVLKYPLHIKGASIPKINRDAEASYERMKESGVPLPAVYERPSTFQDTHDPKNGGFWLMEKMAEPVTSQWRQGATIQNLSGKEKEVVEFVKAFLTRSAMTGNEVINDFFPRNVMRNAQGKLCIVDFSSECEGGKWEFETNMFKYLLAWSNGNQHVWNYLIKDFPTPVAQLMTEMLNAEKAKRGGAFPPSSQV